MIVLRGIAAGKKNAQIADDFPPEMAVSEHGVRYHREQLYRRLAIHTIAEAVLLAQRLKLL